MTLEVVIPHLGDGVQADVPDVAVDLRLHFFQGSRLKHCRSGWLSSMVRTRSGWLSRRRSIDGVFEKLDEQPKHTVVGFDRFIHRGDFAVQGAIVVYNLGHLFCSEINLCDGMLLFLFDGFQRLCN